MKTEGAYGVKGTGVIGTALWQGRKPYCGRQREPAAAAGHLPGPDGTNALRRGRAKPRPMARIPLARGRIREAKRNQPVMFLKLWRGTDLDDYESRNA